MPVTSAQEDLYAILGVAPAATAEELRDAHRCRVRQTHPDRNPGDPDAEAAFIAVSGAYEVLGDPARRARYDEDRAAAVAGASTLGSQGFGEPVVEPQPPPVRPVPPRSAQPTPPPPVTVRVSAHRTQSGRRLRRLLLTAVLVAGIGIPLAVSFSADLRHVAKADAALGVARGALKATAHHRRRLLARRAARVEARTTLRDNAVKAANDAGWKPAWIVVVLLGAWPLSGVPVRRRMD